MRRALLVALLLGAAAAQEPPAGPEARVAALLDRAQELITAGKTDEALAQIKAARELAGDKLPWATVRSLQLEGYAAIRARNWRAADAALATIVEKHAAWPQTPEVLLQLGRVRVQLGREKEAREAWQRVVTEAPASLSRLDAERELIESDLRAADLKSAAGRIDALQASMPWLQALPALLQRLGSALLEAGQPAEALSRFEAIGKLAPGSEPALAARRLMVTALGRLKRTDEALELLARAEQQQPEARAIADIAELRAEVLEDCGEWEKAVAALDGLARRYPGSYLAAQATQRQIDLLRKHDQLPAAIDRLKALEPSLEGPFWQVQTLRELLGLYRAAKQHDQAEDTAAALIKLTEGSPIAADALLQMARAQRDAGRKKAARQSLEKLVQTYKGGPVVPMAEALLVTWDEEDKTAP